MNIIICEDELFWSNALRESVHQWAYSRSVEMNCLCCVSPKELLIHLNGDIKTDAILLDITFEDSEIDGVATAKHLRGMGHNIPIIFVTGDSSRASDGYLVEAVGFLSKPIDEKRMFLFLDRIIKQQSSEKTIRIASESETANVRLNDIVYVEVMNHTIIYHTIQSDISLRGTLAEALDQLGKEDFVQIHRAYLIPINKIFNIKTAYPYAVDVLKGLTTINLPVGRKFVGRLLELHADEILEKML